MTTIPITAEETRLSLKALRQKLDEAYHYSYGYYGAPSYIQLQIASISLRLQRLITTVSTLQSRSPAQFYKPRQPNNKGGK